jgi:FdhE protein
MTNNTVQQMLIDFNKEFTKIVLPDDAVTVVRPQAGLLKSLMENDAPIIKICPPQANADIFFDVLKNVAGIVVKIKPDLEGDINKILSALPAAAEARELFVMQAFTPGTNLLESFLESFNEEISHESLVFILNHAVKPFMKLYARKVSAFFDPEQWLKGACPVCGGRPSLALLEKEGGKRYLYCGMCEVRWRIQRLGCPYCPSKESRFFNVEGKEQYRVYYCDNCHGYIKTINEAKRFDSSNLDLFWEDINTVHLDLLAMQEGYVNQPINWIGR